MLSALILSGLGYPAVRLAPQPADQRSVRPGPLVLRTGLRKSPAPTTDRDRTVSRRSEPSSRATLIGEQPNPWDLGLCQYTQRTVAIRAEPALGSLRYPFGGDHPSQTTRQAVSPSGLGPRQQKGGISTAARRGLAPTGLCLPPILHIRCPGSALSCSKGSRGLSVPLRVDGIFTATTISPSSRPRQCPDRYTIRAGRNLPDKEFRYLRTVIVTAAVSAVAGSRPPLTFRHRAGVRPYASSFDFAKPCVFGKQSPGPLLCASPTRGPLLPKLRGHFA